MREHAASGPDRDALEGGEIEYQDPFIICTSGVGKEDNIYSPIILQRVASWLNITGLNMPYCHIQPHTDVTHTHTEVT